MAGRAKAGAGAEVPFVVALAASRLATSILIALALSGTALLGAVRAERSLESAALRFLMCFVAARVATAIVWNLYEGYRRERDERIAAEEEASRPVAG